MDNNNSARGFKEVALIGVGAFMSLAFQSMNDLANALTYPQLFFPPNANLTNFEVTSLSKFIAGVLIAIYFVRLAFKSNPTRVNIKSSPLAS